MPKGIVVSFERNSGFGFIETESGERIFVHHTAIADPNRKHLVAGQQVEFSLASSERGLQADAVPEGRQNGPSEAPTKLRAEAVNVLRDVPAKAQRKLDWRNRRGSQPRPGDRPRPYRSPVREVEEEEAEEGVLHSPHVANRTPATERTKPTENE